MKKQLVEILVEEFNLSRTTAEAIVDRVHIFMKREQARKGEIIMPLDHVEKALKAVRAYKQLLERHVRAAPEVGTEEITTIQDMRNLEFNIEEYIFANT